MIGTRKAMIVFIPQFAAVAIVTHLFASLVGKSSAQTAHCESYE